MRSTLVRVTYDADANFFINMFMIQNYSVRDNLKQTEEFYEIDNFISCTKPIQVKNPNDPNKTLQSTYIDIEEQSDSFNDFLLLDQMSNYAFNGVPPGIPGTLNRLIEEKLQVLVKNI